MMQWFSRNLQNVILGGLFWFACFLPACSTITPRSPTFAAPTMVAAVETNAPTAALTETSATVAPTPTDTAVPTNTATATAGAPSPSLTSTPSNSPTTPPTQTPFPTLTPIPEPTAMPILPIGEVPGHLGSEVTVAGQVVATASFASGYKFTLDDGSGQVTLLVWSNVYDDCWDAPILNLGAMVRATGMVSQYEGEWEMAPDFGGDVKVTAVGTLPPARAIGSLGDYMGQRVMITGQIGRVEGTSSGAKLFVADESGEIVVFIWNNTLDRIENNQALGVPGTKVQVVGYVQEYRSNREIVPALPYDVTVLP
ncbi:MAG: OB-fold nucleic acid binding domain-containing protein [Chloroflexi bacterium]|nr:OB-fold nucleic acid binding domain-containing protein [Chloroflexota bacterium]MCI0732098.1 OB-fold nucleic acid binding domain-containing protein [Chloroflexota bacterium]